MSGIECSHGRLKRQCNECDLEAEVKQQAETIERFRAAISNLDSMETPSDIKGRFQSELFWRGVYASRDALNKLEAGEL